jgi:hypothetical protein
VSAADLVSALRSRGIALRVEAGRLKVAPATGLIEEERAFLVANANEVARILRSEVPEPTAQQDGLTIDLTLDTIIQVEANADDARLLPPRKKLVLYRTTRGGFVPLHRLSAADVRRLWRREAIAPDEVREWLRERAHAPSVVW